MIVAQIIVFVLLIVLGIFHCRHMLRIIKTKDDQYFIDGSLSVRKVVRTRLIYLRRALTIFVPLFFVFWLFKEEVLSYVIIIMESVIAPQLLRSGS